MRTRLGMIGLGVAVVLASVSAVRADLVSGYVQRFNNPATNYSGGVWTATVGNNATAADSQFFSVVTNATPSGLSALSNITADDNAKLTFDFSSGWSTNGFTVFGVAKLNAEQGNGRGPLGSPQSADWGGARLGIGSSGDNNLRVEAGNTNPGEEGGDTALRANGNSSVAVGDWFIFAETVTKNNGSGQAVATLSIYSLSDLASLGTATKSLSTGDIQGIGSTTNLFSSTGSGGWQAAMADLVIYNSVLSSGDITANIASLQSTYLTAAQTPEPGTCVLLASALAGLLAYAWRKRK